MQLLTPNTILQNRYLVVRTIGQGGMGAVYEATDQRLGITVALKQTFFSDDLLSKAFERETRLLAGLRHPVLPNVTDHFVEDNGQFLIMEFIPGDDLAMMLSLRNSPFPVANVLPWADQLLDALDYLHAHQPPIIHRDIKPQNLKLTPRGEIILLDFGLSKGPVLDMSISGRSLYGFTPHYAPLEQIQGKGTDPRSDLFALAATLYHLMTGVAPPDALTRADDVLGGKPDPLRPAQELNSQVPSAIADVVFNAMALNRDRRPASAATLRAVLHEEGSHSMTPISSSDQATLVMPPPESSELSAGHHQQGRDSEKSASLTDGPSSFIARPPVTHPRRFFGRQRELKRLFNLWKHTPLQNAAIIGPRRSGKTSLLHYLKNSTTTSPSQLRPGQRADWLSQPERYRWIFVDFQDSRLGSREGLLRYLLAQLNLSAPDPCDLDHFMNAVSRHLRTPTIMLMDEISVGLERYSELDDSFWEGLRSLATNQVEGNLAFVLASHESPDRLAQDSGLGSPFFNIFGYTASLGPLTEPEARELIASSPIPFDPADVEWILEKSGRWPILLQILCRERLIALEEGEPDGAWREEGLRQTGPFRHLLTNGAS